MKGHTPAGAANRDRTGDLVLTNGIFYILCFLAMFNKVRVYAIFLILAFSIV